MTSPYIYMLAGAVGYAVLAAIYRRWYDATARDVDTLAKSNHAQSQTIGTLRAENAALRSLVVDNGLTPPVPQGLSNEDAIRDEINRGRLINAIKLYRQSTGVGLKEAKDIVEAMAAVGNVGTKTYSPTVDTDDRIAELVRSGNKIAAIRDYRAATGASLLDAKNYIEELERNQK